MYGGRSGHDLISAQEPVEPVDDGDSLEDDHRLGDASAVLDTFAVVRSAELEARQAAVEAERREAHYQRERDRAIATAAVVRIVVLHVTAP